MADAKIISYGKDIGAGTTVIPDNQVALDIESTDAKEYIEINTSDSAPTIVLGKDGAKVGIGDPAPAALLGVRANASSGDWLSVRDNAGSPSKVFVVSTANGDDGIAIVYKDGLASHKLDSGAGVVFNEEGRANTDFRVESDSNTHMLFVDGGANAIGINQSSADAPLHIVGVGGDTGKAWSTGGDSPTMIIENSDGSSKNRCLLALNGDGSSGSSVDLYHQDTRLAGLAGYPGNASVYGQAVTLTLEATGANVVILKTNSKARMTVGATGTVEITGGLDVQGAGTIESISTATVTGSGSAFLTKFSPGSAIKFTNDADGTETRTVLSVASNTELVLTETPGATGAGRGTKTYFHDPDLFEIKSGDGLSRLKYDALGQLTVCNTGQNNVIVSDGDITQMTGANNTILGAEQLAAISVSSRTTIGHRAGKGMTGASLTAVGGSCGESDAGSSGAEVTIVGYFSGNAGPGNSAVAVGARALSACQSGGTANVAVGASAGIAITTGDNNTCIGNASNAAATLSNQIAIGAGAVCSAVSTAVVGDASNPTTLNFAGSGNSWSTTSDERIKENIQDSDLGLEFINALRPITHTAKNPTDWPDAIKPSIYTTRIVDGPNGQETIEPNPRPDDVADVKDGLLAQEVKAVMDAQGVGFSGWTEEVNGLQRIQYERLVLPLIKSVQELSSHIATLTARIEELENGE